jgi:hypothetical protein
MRSWSWDTGVSADRGKERVAGRFNPGKDVRRTFTVGEAMLSIANLLRCWLCYEVNGFGCCTKIEVAMGGLDIIALT